jgi:glycosyltransferase involved in cell wall biosynthesis
MNGAPDISVVMPFRDAASTVGNTLESVAAQTLGAFELLAIDDGSVDESSEIVRRFAEQDPRVRLIQPGRIGLVACLNLGLEQSRSPFWARMDADDLMHEDRLRLQREFLDRHGNVALVASQVELIPLDRIRTGYREYVRWQNGCLDPEEIAANIYVESPFAHPSVMVRRSVLVELGGYAEGPFPEDYELWLRMHHAGYRMAKIPRVLLSWRDHDQRLSRVDSRCSGEAFDRLRARFLARDPRIPRDRDLVVWGTRRRTRLRVRLAMDLGVRPMAWVDINRRKTGKRIWDLLVHPPEWLDRQPRPFVLVYVRSRRVRDEIRSFLEGLGYCCGTDFLPVG